MREFLKLLVLPLLLALASIKVSAQPATPDCKQFIYSQLFHSCVAEFVFPWVPISHVEGKLNEGYNAHFVLSNNTSGPVAILDAQYINTALDNTVQQHGHVIISVNGQRMGSAGISSTLSPGDTVSFDIVDTECQYDSNLCTAPPPEMDLAVKVIVGGDPEALSNLIAPTINVKDTLSGKMIWQYRYSATPVSQASTAVSANIYVGGDTTCAIAAMNVDTGSGEPAEMVAFLLDPESGETFDQGSFGVLLADQNRAMSCAQHFPKITTLTNPSNFDLLVVTKAQTSKLAIIVPQIGGGGGMGGFVTSQAVFPDLLGLQRLK